MKMLVSHLKEQGVSILNFRDIDRADPGGDLYDAPAALLMHGNEADPVFCYANRTAQGLWGLTWDEFIRLPSRLSAEPLVPGGARPAAGARARSWFHRRLPGCADRKGRHALPHLGRGGVDGGGRRRDAWAGGAVPGVGAHLSLNLGRRRR